MITVQGELIDRQAVYIEGLENLLVSKYQKDVTVTAYTASVKECDGTPHQTAVMTKPRPGTVAVSRDLFNSGWTFGKKVYIPGHGVFTIADLMNERHTLSIDIFMGKRKEAIAFGKNIRKAVLIAG
jgi:3D (Asp-Asp-Asp) domain-containing protein